MPTSSFGGGSHLGVPWKGALLGRAEREERKTSSNKYPKGPWIYQSSVLQIFGWCMRWHMNSVNEALCVVSEICCVTSGNVLKKRLEKVWAEVFPHRPPCLDRHPPPLTPAPKINSYHCFMLPNSMLYICGFFRTFVALFLPLWIIIMILNLAVDE